MMQICDSYNQKHSLFNAMNRFLGAVNNMDQTVMVPSLLRDVPLDSEEEDAAGKGTTTVLQPHLLHHHHNHNGATGYFTAPRRDMHSYYVLLKSIRTDIEWGVLQGEDRLKKDKLSGVEGGRPEETETEEDLEQEFHYHLSGLHTVLAKLTRKAHLLTNRYKEEIGAFATWSP